MIPSRRGLLAAFLGLAVAVLAPAQISAASEYKEGANNFVRALAAEAVSSLTGNSIGENQREKKLRQILRNYFDVKSIARLALGRYWKRASKSQRAQYMTLFEDLIVVTYSNRFKDYSNEKLLIENTIANEKYVLVKSLVDRGAQQPIRVDWRVTFTDGRYKIIDVVVEGVSMVQTQRSEFSSVIRRSGGKVEGLLTALRDKTINVSQN
jgi:phospholipid transport system substrate-binding protein